MCARIGLSARTLGRWRNPATAEDRRCGPHTVPSNKLSAAERNRILETANSQRFRDLSPKQIVPRLADESTYLGSESSFYRVLRAEQQMAHRGPTRAPSPRLRPQHLAEAPNQVWTWDITYLRSCVRGAFFYLYLYVDVHSRRIVGWQVYLEESAEHSTDLFLRTWEDAGSPEALTVHSDNGSPMKASTLLATMHWLGVIPSFSRPRVSNDNPFSESLFRTLKYRPCFPQKPFETVDAARAWVERFVDWYNTEHRHSAIRFVTPNERHHGREHHVLANRRLVYAQARRRNPARWSGPIRDWTPAGAVRLGPSPDPEARQAA